MIIVVGCNKGGAAKTTTCTNLTVELVREGADVCLVDADPMLSASKFHAKRELHKDVPQITLMQKFGNMNHTLISLQAKYEHVLVDVAGRNSAELISAMCVADMVIAPHQCSDYDLDTLEELRDQHERIIPINPKLRIRVYHAMASTNPVLKFSERETFMKYLSDFPQFEVLNSIGYHRKVYRDSAKQGLSVVETDNVLAADEIKSLLQEVLHG